jgi:hypothetical protein
VGKHTDARKELKDARNDLDRIAKRDKEESDDFNRANNRVIDAEKALPWWKR